MQQALNTLQDSGKGSNTESGHGTFSVQIEVCCSMGKKEDGIPYRPFRYPLSELRRSSC
jgi:hypothetical protein